MPNTDLNKDTVGWNNINWRQVEHDVFKLQKRIYAASQRGDIKQVRKLQKTLIRSWSGRVLAIRKVTQDNQGRKTAGVDGVKSLTPSERMEMVPELKPKGKSQPTRRVWIPKPGTNEKRPLGIPTIFDRSLQALVKSALEAEWEAIFEPNSFGFRPGRSAHDAITQIKLIIKQKAKYVLDADIAKCFDRIDHNVLLNKLNIRGKIRQQIKAWLKSGVIDNNTFTATSEGTPQGGVISPLLANVALHGMEIVLKQYAETLDLRYPNGRKMKIPDRISSLSIVRYADDFVIFHEEKKVVEKCREIITDFLKEIGLQLKAEKTRLAHTLYPENSEDGKAGFDFLGYHIQQYQVGINRSDKNSKGKPLGFCTTITPAKSACESHQKAIKEVLRKYKSSSSQEEVINDLNPIIQGWCEYHKVTDAKTVGEFQRQDYLMYLKLRRWAKRRCGSTAKGHYKYWRKIGKRNWAFATNGDNPKVLLTHTQFHASSIDYVKVKGEVSPYNGNFIYWGERMGKHPDVSNRKAKLLKKQKGKCNWCGLHFREEDTLEVDHIKPTSTGGKDNYTNLQLLHKHCHDVKTATDGSLKSH